MRDTLTTAAVVSVTLLGIGLAIVTLLPTGLSILKDRGESMQLNAAVALRRIRSPVILIGVATALEALTSALALLGLQFCISVFAAVCTWTTVSALIMLVAGAVWAGLEIRNAAKG